MTEKIDGSNSSQPTTVFPDEEQLPWPAEQTWSKWLDRFCITKEFPEGKYEKCRVCYTVTDFEKDAEIQHQEGCPLGTPVRLVIALDPEGEDNLPPAVVWSCDTPVEVLFVRRRECFPPIEMAEGPEDFEFVGEDRILNLEGAEQDKTEFLEFYLLWRAVTREQAGLE